MVFGVKGPKAVLSTAIASALAEYFVLDSKLIESNLLKDTKIVLHNVKLRDQIGRIPQNSAGYPTVITVTGCVDEVTFTWVWSVRGGGPSWVKDAVLTIRGIRFKAKLSHDTTSHPTATDAALMTSSSSATSSNQHRESFNSAIKENAAEIKKEGGLYGYMKKQVEMIIDSLTLHVLDFEFIVEMPPPLTPPPPTPTEEEKEDEKADAGRSSSSHDADVDGVNGGGEDEKNNNTVSISVGGHKIGFVSHGRIRSDGDKEEDISSSDRKKGKGSSGSATSSNEMDDDDSNNGVLRQVITVESMYMNVLATTWTTKTSSDGKKNDTISEVTTTHPFMEPFTYVAQADRIGKRFGGFQTGLVVTGNPIVKGEQKEKKTGGALLSDDAEKEKEKEEVKGDDDNGGRRHLVIHAGTEQFEAMAQLGVMLLAPPTDDDHDNDTTTVDDADKDTAATANAAASDDENPLKSAAATVAVKDENKDDNDSKKKSNSSVGTKKEDPAPPAAATATAEAVVVGGADKVSTFTFPIPSVSLIVQKSTRMTLPKLIFNYHADGTVMYVIADGFQLTQTSDGLSLKEGEEKSGDGTPTTVSVSGIKATIRPIMKLDMNSIDTLFVPDVMELTCPIEKATIVYEGTTMSIQLNSIEATKLRKGQKKRATTTEETAIVEHQFEERTYGSPTKCAVCGGLLKGLWNQGLQCKVCGMNVHKEKDCRSAALLSSCCGHQEESTDNKEEEKKKKEDVIKKKEGVVTSSTPDNISNEKKEEGKKATLNVTESSSGTKPKAVSSTKKETAITKNANDVATTDEMKEKNNNGDTTALLLKSEGSETVAKHHQFEERTYGSPTNCDVCGGLLKGLWNQGLQCKICNMNIHKKCLTEASARVCQKCPVISSKEQQGQEEEGGSGNERKEKEEAASTDAEETSAPLSVPIPMNISIKSIHIQSSTDNSMVKFHNLDLYLNPDKLNNCTQIAFSLNEVQNDLLHLTGANVYANLPLDKVDEIHNFNASFDEVNVTAGRSKEEWQSKFEPDDEKKKAKAQVMKFPHCTIAPLNLKISWKSTMGVSVKDTSVSIKRFVGKGNTTSNDLINYYAAACLNHAPGFVSNLDVGGLNVVDTAASTYGALLLPGAGGLVAITAVDGVKGAVAAGKRSRNVHEGEGWKPGDLVRGVVYAAGEATKSAAVKRGREDGKGNIGDFAVGLTEATGDYVGENKSRLGGAGAAGAGFILGTMIGGPVGGIIGGVVANAVAQKSIEGVEDYVANRQAVEQQKQYEKNKLPALKDGPTDLVTIEDDKKESAE